MISAAITSAAVAVDQLKQDVANLKSIHVNEALPEWYLTREEYKALDDLRTDIYHLLESVSKGVLPEMMRDAKVKTLSIDGSNKLPPLRFTVSQRWSCSMIDKDAGMNWLKENGQEGIIQMTVNAQTLASFAKSHVEKEGKDLPEDIFKVGITDNISATKV